MISTSLPYYLRSEFEGLQLEAFELIEQADAMVEDMWRSVVSNSMQLAEALFRNSVRNRILTDYDTHIRWSAKDEFQITIMRAIVFEEQVHEKPPFIEFALEEIGCGDSVGPAQIKVSKWAEHFNTSREDLLNPEKHFKVMRQLLDEIETLAFENGMERTPENIGTLWNNMRARSPSDYGKRVGRYYEEFAKEKDSDQAGEAIVGFYLEFLRKQNLLREREPREMEEKMQSV
ncbi:MAG: hypothetical protein QNJ13_12495 [Paracoccaceae bacterium]|nr:hypothetical protein [Paracoccaceae bacterium]